MMKIEQLLNEILLLRKELMNRTQTYFSDSDFISIIDNQLNAKAKVLLLYLNKNGLSEYSELLNSCLPVDNDAIEFCEIFYSIEDEILNFEKFNNPNSRAEIINQLAYHMQEKYVRWDIDNLFSSCNIKCGDEFYTYNSKRVYVQNVLKEARTVDIIKLAKAENLIKENIDITESIFEISNKFIEEQIEKCNSKIINKDYDGAITNARSLIEEILLLIEEKINGHRENYDGDILKLYKRVRKLLNLEPNNTDIENSLNEITRGFVSIISGLSGLSNGLGDRHAQRYKPDKRHSILIVNSALVIAQFLAETYNYQYN